MVLCRVERLIVVMSKNDVRKVNLHVSYMFTCLKVSWDFGVFLLLELLQVFQFILLRYITGQSC